MRRFALKELPQVKGKQKFFELFDNDKSEFQDFCDNIEGKYESELLNMFSWMNLVANLQSVPYKKFHELNANTEGVKEYEFKSKHLRVYLFKLESVGKIIVCGGSKTNQKNDISKFRTIKSSFLNAGKDDNTKKVN